MGPFYVNMTDKFMSGWGGARGRKAYYCIRCETLYQAEAIEQAARRRPEMKYVTISDRPRPARGNPRTIKDFSQMGGAWLAYWKPGADPHGMDKEG